MSLSLPIPLSTNRRSSAVPMLGLLVLAELRRMLRNPIFALATIGFPIMFFAFFGLPLVNETTKSGFNIAQIVLVNFGAYSLLSLAMFSFGSAIAVERTGGWLKLLRASPMPIPLYFASRIIAAMVFSTLSLTVLYTFAHFVGGITIPSGLALTVLGKFLLGIVPLIAMGLCIGFLTNPSAAQVLANVVSVIMSFASGLFTPLDEMPGFIQKIAPYLPAYHLGQIGLGTMVGDTGKEPQHWLALAIFTVVFGALAVWGMKKDESREA